MMGLGDELMALGEAQKLAKQRNKPVCIIDSSNNPRNHEYWNGSQYIDMRSDLKLKNCIGHRPYIKGVSNDKILWNPYKPVPADLSHIVGNSKTTLDFIVIEPNLKPGANQNKQWPKEYFETLVSILPNYRFVQLGKPKWSVPGIEIIPTPNLFVLAEILNTAKMYVGVEGGLHHLSAALNVPAIVIYGGFISGRVTGYDIHYNFDEVGLGCGSMQRCMHCKDLMNKITPEIVANKIRERWV